jgi:integrase
MKTSDLPPHVYPVKDRHGKVRHRYIRKGHRSGYLPGGPGSPEFHTAYAALLAQAPLTAAPSSPKKPMPRSLDDLIARFKQSSEWERKGARTCYKQARILERFADRTDQKGRRYGLRPVETITVVWLDRIHAGMASTPAAANELRKVLCGLMDHAIRMGWRTDNPARLVRSYREGEGWHTWTDQEIEQYRARHALGTTARLTLELALNTAARLCNVATLTRADIQNGRIITDHAKGNNEASVPLLATTRAAIEALPSAPIRHLITTQAGKPFSVDGLGNRMRKWCDEAGLPQCSMHGLRKAISRILAEHGATDAEGQAVTGHRKAATFAHYRAKANRTALADRAFSNLVPGEVSNQTENDEKSAL